MEWNRNNREKTDLGTLKNIWVQKNLNVDWNIKLKKTVRIRRKEQINKNKN